MLHGMELRELEGKIGLLTIHIIDEETHSHIENTMDEQEKNGSVNYIFDLGHLKFVNSHFIGLLAKKHQYLAKKGGRIVLLNASDIVKKMFTIFGLYDNFPFHTDMEEAIASFKN